MRPPRAPRRGAPPPPEPPGTPPSGRRGPPGGGRKALHTSWPLAAIGAMALAAGNPLTPSTPPVPASAATPAAPVVAHVLGDKLPPDHVSVHFVDVDQAAAAVVEFPCAVVMIDAGARDAAGTQALVGYLNDLFARRPDLHRRINTIFVTHSHTDHNYALQTVAETFQVGGYVYNSHDASSGAKNSKWMEGHVQSAGIPVDAVTEGKVETAGGALSDGVIDSVACARVDPRIEVLSGAYDQAPTDWTPGDFDNENNHSLAIRIEYGQTSFLFTGDMQTAGLDNLVETLQRLGRMDRLRAEVWAVSHHGAENGTDKGFLEAVQPEIAVMSFGHPDIQKLWTAWAYGHPRRTTVEALDAAITRPRGQAEVVQVADGVKRFSPYTVRHAVYGTGWDGTITVDGDANGNLHVSQSGPSAH